MIYIVSGYMRTGTSMMMCCLEAGGISPVLSPTRDKMNEAWGDQHYKPNAKGLYELEVWQSSELGFPQMYGGKAIKILARTLHGISVGRHRYKIIFMLRHPEEIRQSYRAFLPDPPRFICERTMEPDAPYYAVMRDIINIAKQRRDVDLAEFNYKDVISNPLQVFLELVDKGWKINAEAAAAVVDEKQYRFRLENLAIGA